jgi:hypothetical protein
MMDNRDRTSRIFDSYAEFARLTRILNEQQLIAVRESLPSQEIEHLINSRDVCGFYDVESANEFDDCLMRIEQATNWNPVKIKLDLLKGMRLRMPSDIWETVIAELKGVDSEFSGMLIDGIVCRRDAKKPGYVVLSLGGRAS